METGKNTSADRNRKQTGKSEEIVADSAICTCDKGSKPGTFRVTSQQKIYCNGARKLVATDQDKDIKSLNFGSCAAKNNGPCSPNIVWSNTYNKIAIKGKMYPLTVKSSGTCKAGGGRINIQTSGQQVVVKPSSSPRKANSTAYKSPIFTEEDWKHLPQEDEKSQNKRVPAAVQVNNVLVNGKREITITPYDQEELLFTTSLTAGSMRGTGVKWDVCHGNRVIAKGLTEAPARTYFTKEGTYSVYAYLHKPGSPKGKGVVRITVSYPKFKSLEWKDENGKPVTYIGLRNKVFAHVSLPGCKGIPVSYRFYYNGYEGKTYLSALTPMTLSAAGKVKIALSLSDNQLKKIIEDRKRFSNGQKIRIHLELSSRHWIENLTKASQHPILFNDKIEFRSLVIYKDSDCKEKLQGGIADSGSMVYVRVSTANMETGKIRLDVYKHETGNQEEKSSKPSPIYSTNSPVNSTGVYKFSLTLATPPYKEGTAYKVVVSWIFSSQSSNGNVNNNTDRQTSKEPKQYILKGKEILFSVKRHIPTPKAEPSKANVNRTEPEKDGCPRCREEWTDMLPRLQKIFKEVSSEKLSTVARIYTRYMKELRMDTCWIKAHFFAQAYKETGGKLDVKKGESFNYYWEIIPTKLSAFRTDKGRFYARQWGRAEKKSTKANAVSKENQIKIANYAYSYEFSKGKELGNKYPNDGWHFRGRGLIQLTGRACYTAIEKILHDIGYSCDITSSIEKSDQVGKNFELAVVASMAFFKWKNVDMYRLCNGNKNTTGISTIVGMKETNKDTGKSNYEEKQEAFTNRTSVAFMVDNCKWDVKESPKQTPKQGKWHEPVDNPQITIWTQSGRNEPSNAVFGAKRPNGHYHQGLDIFCVEGTRVYACLDGTIEAISKAYSGQGQTIFLKITDKEQLEAFRKRRLSYIPFYKGEWKEGPNFNPDSNEIYFVYYHLREILVNSGTVHAGDVIGLSGISGIEKGTHGPHLHFEIRSKRWCNGLNNRCNPAYYVNYRNDKKLSPEEKKRQEDRKNLGQLKDFNGKIKK
jgi:M23 peptidase domain-containing protein (fragment)